MRWPRTAPVPAEPPSGTGRDASGNFLALAAIWLVFLYQPAVAAWHAPAGVRWPGLGIVVAFASLYLWHFHRSRRFAWADPRRSEPRETAGRLTRWVLLAALASVATAVIGQPGAVCFVFVAVAGLFAFPIRAAVLLAAVIAAGYWLATNHVPGWTADPGTAASVVLSVAAVSGGMIASRRGAALGEAQRENARLALEEERNRVARDVHDILGHTLTVIRVKAELAAALIDVAPDRAKTEVLALEELSREALADVRRAVEGFREISLPGEIARSRSAFAAAGITAQLPGSVDEVSPDLRELFAWAVREGTTNIVRHSAARTCRITLEPTRLTISDDGRGADETAVGAGLIGLRERAAAVGAIVHTRALEPGLELTVHAPQAATSRVRGDAMRQA